jgi:hypothetical protein
MQTDMLCTTCAYEVVTAIIVSLEQLEWSVSLCAASRSSKCSHTPASAEGSACVTLIDSKYECLNCSAVLIVMHTHIALYK